MKDLHARIAAGCGDRCGIRHPVGQLAAGCRPSSTRRFCVGWHGGEFGSDCPRTLYGHSAGDRDDRRVSHGVADDHRRIRCRARAPAGAHAVPGSWSGDGCEGYRAIFGSGRLIPNAFPGDEKTEEGMSLRQPLTKRGFEINKWAVLWAVRPM